MLSGDPLFEAIWSVIKSWDVNVPEYYNGYCGANGSHVALIYEAVEKATSTRVEEVLHSNSRMHYQLQAARARMKSLRNVLNVLTELIPFLETFGDVTGSSKTDVREMRELFASTRAQSIRIDLLERFVCAKDLGLYALAKDMLAWLDGAAQSSGDPQLSRWRDQFANVLNHGDE
jgi:hypothetical protein